MVTPASVTTRLPGTDSGRSRTRSPARVRRVRAPGRGDRTSQSGPVASGPQSRQVRPAGPAPRARTMASSASTCSKPTNAAPRTPRAPAARRAGPAPAARTDERGGVELDAVAGWTRQRGPTHAPASRVQPRVVVAGDGGIRASTARSAGENCCSSRREQLVPDAVAQQLACPGSISSSRNARPRSARNAAQLAVPDVEQRRMIGPVLTRACRTGRAQSGAANQLQQERLGLVLERVTDGNRDPLRSDRQLRSKKR